jgi:hypothetical protein
VFAIRIAVACLSHPTDLTPTDPLRATFDGRVDVPAGGWVAARASGPTSPYLGNDYAFAHTSPVYVVRGERRFVKAADVQFLAETVDTIAARVEKARWRSDANRQAFQAAIDKAGTFYQSLMKSPIRALPSSPAQRPCATSPGVSRWTA